MVDLGATASRVEAETMVGDMIEVRDTQISYSSLLLNLIIILDYGGYSGGSSSGFRDDSGRRGFDEYNAGDDEISGSRRSNSITTESSFSTIPPRTSSTAASSTVPSKSQEKVVDLLGFDDDDFAAPISAPPTASGKEKALPALAALDGTSLIHLCINMFSHWIERCR